jgi:hypothetical protein
MTPTIRAVAILVLFLGGCVRTFPQSGKPAPISKTDPTPTASSAIWLSPIPSPCGTSKKIVLVLRHSTTSTQPYFIQISADELPTFYSGDQLNIELDATEDDAKEIPLVNIAVDLQKADPTNIAPVRPSIGQTSAEVSPKVKPQYFCMSWPAKLIGDTVPKITVTAIYKPAPASSGTATEKTLTLLVASFPQVHTLYHYNIATGVVVSSVRDPSFARVQSSLPSPGNPAQFQTVQQSGDVYVAPVLFFTAYIKPMDAERDWHWGDMIPGPSIGFSLSAPTDNFFFGGSSEIRRNVQLVYGYHMGRVAQLAKTIVNDPTSSASPATVRRFKGGIFGGLTFNIDFIKNLFLGK